MRVLIAVDDSSCSQTAVEAAADRSWPEASLFKVITVIEPLALQYSYGGAVYGLESVLEAEEQLAVLLGQKLDKQVEKLARLFGKDNVSGQVLEGFVAETIIAEAKKWNADLIVCGSHGRRGMKRFLLGSVAEKVVCNAHCCVEVVKVKPADEAEAVAAGKALKKSGKKG